MANSWQALLSEVFLKFSQFFSQIILGTQYVRYIPKVCKFYIEEDIHVSKLESVIFGM